MFFSVFISYVFSVFLKIIITHDLFLTGFRREKFYFVFRMKEAEGEGQGDGSHAVPWRAMLTLAEAERFSARGCGQGGITPSARSRGTGLPAATFHVCPTFLLLAPSSWECLRLSIPKARCMNLSVGR